MENISPTKNYNEVNNENLNSTIPNEIVSIIIYFNININRTLIIMNSIHQIILIFFLFLRLKKLKKRKK